MDRSSQGHQLALFYLVLIISLCDLKHQSIYLLQGLRWKVVSFLKGTENWMGPSGAQKNLVKNSNKQTQLQIPVSLFTSM